jgi:hypothetical protein
MARTRRPACFEEFLRSYNIQTVSYVTLSKQFLDSDAIRPPAVA